MNTKMNFKILLPAMLVIAELISPCVPYRILAVFPFNSKSHNVMLEAITKGLARKGHQVDVVTHILVNDPPQHYKTIINLDGTVEKVTNSWTVDYAKQAGNNVVPFISKLYGNRLCHLMGLKEMQNLFQNPPNDPPYDILITEIFGANCFIGIGHLFKIPVVTISTAFEYPWIIDIISNGDNPAYVPSALNRNTEMSNFWDRLWNWLTYNKAVWDFYSYTNDNQTEAMRKYLHPEMPPIREIEKNVDLILTNSHSILGGVKPLLPALVQVSGVHIEENVETLTPDLQKWMDESTNGVVYFTLGSMVLIETFSPETLLSFYASFNKIKPVRVLMKIVNVAKLPPGLPDNVRLSAWIPQIPVLAHKNTRAFITHGGLMGCIEALYFGVPLIGIPIFADQPRNIQIFMEKNMSVALDIAKLSEERIDWALQTILNDPLYTQSTKYYSKLYRDRPMSAMDTSIYWIEYIIRNGPKVMKTRGLQYSWFQLALLDIYGFVLSCFVLILLLIYFILRILSQKSSTYARTKLKPSKKLK